MIDLDLGPVVLAIFTVLILIPAIIGFFVGIGVSYLLIRKRITSKLKRVIIMLLVGISLAILFSYSTIEFNNWQTDYENKKFKLTEKLYIEKNLQNFRIENISFDNDAYRLTFTVPRNGRYKITIHLYQDNKEIRLLPKWVDGVDLVTGINTLRIDIVDKNTIPLSADFVIEIKNSDDSFALRNTRKSLAVTNPGTIEKLEGVIYYSPHLEKDNHECPAFNYSDFLPCVPNDLLHLE